jgi:hypothetical protein
MRPSQLPTSNRYFTVENDFRTVLSGLITHLHGIVHVRRPSAKFKQKIFQLNKSTGLQEKICYDLLKGDNQSYDHIAVAVGTNGACYIGEAILNPKSNDQYSRHFGFRLATLKALLAMELYGIDFEIGIEPPENGRALAVMIEAKLKQFEYL